MIGGLFGNRKNERLGLTIAMIFFGVIALGQFWRALAQVSVEFGGHAVPMWFSVIAGSVALLMACWMGSILRHNRPVI